MRFLFLRSFFFFRTLQESSSYRVRSLHMSLFSVSLLRVYKCGFSMTKCSRIPPEHEQTTDRARLFSANIAAWLCLRARLALADGAGLIEGPRWVCCRFDMMRLFDVRLDHYSKK